MSDESHQSCSAATPPWAEQPKPKLYPGYLTGHIHRPLRFDGCIPPMYHEDQRAMRELRRLREERSGSQTLITSTDNLRLPQEIPPFPEGHYNYSPTSPEYSPIAPSHAPTEPITVIQHLPLEFPSSLDGLQLSPQLSPIEAIITNPQESPEWARHADRYTTWHKKKISPHHRPFTPYIEKNAGTATLSMQWLTGESIAVQTIRNWLRTCEEVHGSRCGATEYSQDKSQQGPWWLIDVIDGCLQHVSTTVKYVTLSYVWGTQKTSSCTTKANLEGFKAKGGLFKDENILPDVVSQAVDLVRELGERYLWVDRFCIVQDEGPAKLRQLNAMGQIYSHAYFTLIAAQNFDATAGLCGKRSLSFGEDQRTPSGWEGVGSDELVLQQAIDLMRTRWYSRGWTLQEYLLSRRRVIFHNNTVNWECLCCSWTESHYLDDPSTQETDSTTNQEALACSCAHSPDMGFVFEAAPWPNMFRYARLVALYNRRDLTFPEDVLQAFAGILTHLSRSFPGGFISGLPQMCFDAALLWQPWTKMKRRVSANGVSGSQPPSWSWAGWSGSMNSESWRSAANYLPESDDEMNIHEQCSWKTISTVKWTYSVPLVNKSKTIEVPPALARPDFDIDTMAKLPRGWSIERDASCDRQYFHTCDPLQPFRYPIPIRDHYKAHIPPVTVLNLNTTTHRAFLKLGATYNSSASNCPAVDLLDSGGRWCGVLRLNRTLRARDVKAFFQNEVGKHNGTVELIEISAGEVRNQAIEEKSFDEWNREECPRHKGLYEFINVLWIRWENGVAQREALGRVTKDVWRETATEKIPVVLA